MHPLTRLAIATVCIVALLCSIPIPLAAAATHGSGSAGPRHTTKAATTSFYDCGDTCENQDPYTTGSGSLSNGAYMANAESIFDQSGTKLAMVGNWYSPECGTNWNVTYLYASTATKISIYRDNTLPTYCYPTDCNSFYTQSASPLWTNMAYAPTTNAYAITTARSPNDQLYYTANIGA